MATVAERLTLAERCANRAGGLILQVLIVGRKRQGPSNRADIERAKQLLRESLAELEKV